MNIQLINIWKHFGCEKLRKKYNNIFVTIYHNIIVELVNNYKTIV